MQRDGGRNARAGGRDDQPGLGPGTPARRPSWFVLLSAMMLAYGGMLLVRGLTDLRDPRATGRLPLRDVLAAANSPLHDQGAALSQAVIDAHTPAIRASAAASLVLALLMLYAAAATLSGDRRGRTAALGAAWLGIAYQIGTLLLEMPMVREYARAGAPLLAQVLRAQRDAGESAPTLEELASALQSLLVSAPVAAAAVGIAGSLVLINYFGGRRGRALYGVSPPRGNR